MLWDLGSLNFSAFGIVLVGMSRDVKCLIGWVKNVFLKEFCGYDFSTIFFCYLKFVLLKSGLLGLSVLLFTEY